MQSGYANGARFPMNWIPGFQRCLLIIAAAAAAGCETQVSDPLAPVDPLVYQLDYTIVADPDNSSVAVTMEVRQPRSLLRELRFRADDRISDIAADGELILDGSEATWRLPERGGSIRWQVTVPHRRNGDGYDAWLGPDFGLFRAEDIIPRAASRSVKGASSETTLSFRLPSGWSVVSQYFDDEGRFRIDNAERRFDQPSGWLVLGDLGVRRERIAGVRVAIAGPVGHSVRRLDTLALLNWTLPELARVLPELPPRLTIVSAGDPMWRGGLSAPLSFFVHADRPLISENATSTLLHEIMHMSLRFKAVRGYDWIVEGLAEFYSLQLLRRSGTITDDRYRQAIVDLASWSQQTESLCKASSTGATTALAVGVFFALDAEIRESTDGNASLDDVAALLWKFEDKVDATVLRNLAEQLTGAKPDALHSDRLPGCRSISEDPAQD